MLTEAGFGFLSGDTLEPIPGLSDAVLTVPVAANGKKAALVQHMADGFVDDDAQSKKLAELDKRLTEQGRLLDRIVKKIGA